MVIPSRFVGQDRKVKLPAKATFVDIRSNRVQSVFEVKNYFLQLSNKTFLKMTELKKIYIFQVENFVQLKSRNFDGVSGIGKHFSVNGNR